MSIAEMKIEAINKITAENKESVLQEVITLLSNDAGKDDKALNLSKHYGKIKEQYRDVLQKLAQ